MKLKYLLIAVTITFTGLTFSACTDESENIVPQPDELHEGLSTVGNGGKDDDID